LSYGDPYIITHLQRHSQVWFHQTKRVQPVNKNILMGASGYLYTPDTKVMSS